MDSNTLSNELKAIPIVSNFVIQPIDHIRADRFAVAVNDLYEQQIPAPSGVIVFDSHEDDSESVMTFVDRLQLINPSCRPEICSEADINDIKTKLHAITGDDLRHYVLVGNGREDELEELSMGIDLAVRAKHYFLYFVFIRGKYASF